MGIKILTDSGSDLMNYNSSQLVCLPLIIRFDQEEYRDGIDLSHREFYEKLIEEDVLPSTSQVSPYVFEEAARKVLEEGDTPIIITISSKLSGTYNSAVLGTQDLEGVHVVDSLNAACGQKALVLYALQLAKEGKSAEEIVKILNEEKKNVRLVALLDTLEYLKKGGRISSTAALAGSLLNIKPVIALEDGEVTVLGKARGSRKGSNFLMEQIEKYGGIDFDRPFCLGYTGLDTTLIDKYILDSRPIWQPYVPAPETDTVGGAIGTHAGPGAIAVAFFSKQ